MVNSDWQNIELKEKVIKRMYECAECGKNEVDKPGEWCSECQKQAEYEDQESEARWFAESRLCQRCACAWGPEPSDKCSAYNMPLWMIARKNKCKRFKEIDYSLEMHDYY